MDQSNPLPSGSDVEPSVLIGQMLLNLQHSVSKAMSRARKQAVQAFLVLSVVLLLLWIAAFLYGSFYYSYMPRAAFSAPVHYYYRTDCESMDSRWCSYPVANISLMRNKQHVLTFGQAYQISLELQMPDSPINRELGMFMIKTNCFARDGGQVASSARSASQQLSASSSRFVSTTVMHNNLYNLIRAKCFCFTFNLTYNRSILRYRSDLLRNIGTLLFLPAFLTGVTEQRQTLDVELFSDYTDDPYAPSTTAVIEILSNKVQIYSSQLNIHAHFTGLRYLLFNFPLLSALVGVSSNFLFLSMLFIFSYLRQMLKMDWKTERHRANGHLVEQEDNVDNHRDNDSSGSAELLGPLQFSRSQQEQNTGNGTDQPDRQALDQSEEMSQRQPEGESVENDVDDETWR